MELDSVEVEFELLSVVLSVEFVDLVKFEMDNESLELPNGSGGGVLTTLPSTSTLPMLT